MNEKKNILMKRVLISLAIVFVFVLFSTYLLNEDAKLYKEEQAKSSGGERVSNMYSTLFFIINLPGIIIYSSIMIFLILVSTNLSLMEGSLWNILVITLNSVFYFLITYYIVHGIQNKNSKISRDKNKLSFYLALISGILMSSYSLVLVTGLIVTLNYKLVNEGYGVIASVVYCLVAISLSLATLIESFRFRKNPTRSLCIRMIVYNAIALPIGVGLVIGPALGLAGGIIGLRKINKK